MHQLASGPSIWALAGPFAAAALALLPAGFAKLRDPSAAMRAMRGVGLAGGRGVVRALGLAEVVAGGAAIALGGRVAAAAIAALYLLFALFLVRALRAAEPLDSCGCMGDRDVPPNGFHLTLVLMASAVAAAAAASPVQGVPAMIGRAPLAGTGIVVGAGGLVYAAFLVVSQLPWALSAYRPANDTTSRTDRQGPAPRFHIAGAP